MTLHESKHGNTEGNVLFSLSTFPHACVVSYANVCDVLNQEKPADWQSFSVMCAVVFLTVELCIGAARWCSG